ncbi:putative 3-ketoacyl-CoA reductase [Dioszegia hungarica]|uniref:Very-long-chain 3-oxoacyl-CoA reductase n=1 Tax=Dioszegia hungarica TaxID=4972 RepID=A0AA38HEN9_9TREE|nr:putative 3-ketoacyl-CoA reductase [Dioszegia hungarica]KAI9639145.1 putative 3-ketoacyl-CoA reductase [Dioszegia hungarica]
MVLDTVHAKAGSHLSSPFHPTYRVLGQDITVDLPLPTLILATFGALVALRYLVSFLTLLAQLTVLPGRDIKSFKTRNGKTWAVVTGATGGIGLEFARQLAKKGYNIVVLGRRQEVLEEVSRELETKYKVETRFLVVDFASPSSRGEKFAELGQMVQSLDLGVLVNNVGASHEMPVAFAETEAEEIDNIVQTNILGTLHLTRLLLPRLLSRSSKKGSPKSLVLNIGSMSGRIPSALLATYSLTKGGLQTWSQALAVEVEGQGVMVRMVIPAFVVSNMSKIRRASLLVPSAPAFVSSTLGSIGQSRGAQGRAYECTPYPTHALVDYGVGLLGWVSELGAMKVVKGMHVDIRKRALRKREREAKGK